MHQNLPFWGKSPNFFAITKTNAAKLLGVLDNN